MEKKKTKLNLWDFDGTLFDSPLQESGVAQWEEKNKAKFPHIGWWSKPESLCLNTFDIQPLTETYNTYLAELEKEDVLNVLMTGRLFRIKEHVEKVLEKFESKFDHRYFNTGGDTFVFKSKKLDELLLRYPHVTEVEIWEDRQDHVDKFTQWAEGKAFKFKINKV